MDPEELRKQREAEALAEMAEMDKMFEQPVLDDPHEALQAPVEEPPVEEPPAEEPTEKETVPPTEEAAVKDTPPVDSPPADEYDFDFLNDLARQAVAKQAGTPVPAPPPVQAPPPVPEAQVPAVPTPALPSTQLPTDFVTKEELDAAINSDDQAGALLNVFQKVFAKMQMSAAELALTQLPQVAQPVMLQMARNIALVDNFYKTNPDLDKARDFVQYCAMQVEAKHPEYDGAKVLEEAAKLARTRMPALQAARAAAAKQPPKPAFATQARGAKQKPPGGQALSDLERELAEMPDSPY